MRELPKIPKLYNDKYFGRKLICVSECCRDRKQFRAKEHYIVRNADGKLGHMGDGMQSFLNFMQGTGPYAFNPLKEEDIFWSPAHDAFFFKHSADHAAFPVKMGEFYSLKDGVKGVGYFENEPVTPLDRHNKAGFIR